MKIYHIALLSKGEPNAAMTRAMRDNSHDVVMLDWIAYRSVHGIEKLRAQIVNDVSAMKPDIVFMQIQAEGVIDIATAQSMSLFSFVVNWTGDVRTNIEWYKQLAPFIGITLFSNMTDVREMWQCGLRADYLQVGYDEQIYNNNGRKSNLYPDIVFLGNNYISGPSKFPLTKNRIEMVQYMKNRFNKQFEVYGSGWVGSKRINSDVEAVGYRSTKIAINQNHFDYEKFSSDRIFRAMACGAFMVSKYYKGIEDEFVIGEHLECYSTLQELEDVCRYYLNNDDERKRIANNGMNHVRNYHTWNNRFDELIKIIEGK